MSIEFHMFPSVCPLQSMNTREAAHNTESFQSAGIAFAICAIHSKPLDIRQVCLLDHISCWYMYIEPEVASRTLRHPYATLPTSHKWLFVAVQYSFDTLLWRLVSDASAWKLRAHLAPTKLDKTPTLVPNNTSPVCGTQVRTDAESTSASPRLHVLTYATKATSMLCDSLRVAQRVNLKLVLLGWQEQYRGNFQKLEAAREYVARLPPDDLVLFADACVGPLQHVAKSSTLLVFF
eukprot:6193438-Pleurochrysis_carterae.AAC.1